VSEYTNYVAVKGLGPGDIREILRANRIVSIVGNDPANVGGPIDRWS
jgi:hypothetical protein